jgi:hypothetical protein
MVVAHLDLHPQLPVNVTAIIRGQKIVTVETSAVRMKIALITAIIHRQMIPIVEILIVLMETNIITILIHGKITVTARISVVLMEIDTITIVAHGQMIGIAETPVPVPMKIAAKTVAVHLIMIIEET